VVLTHISALVGFLRKIVTSVHGCEQDEVLAARLIHSAWLFATRNSIVACNNRCLFAALWYKVKCAKDQFGPAVDSTP
jgi:hypothetical protein